MQLRYDFGDKLDLTKFKKQAHHYISTLHLNSNEDEFEISFYLKDYRIKSIISHIQDTNKHLVRISISGIRRDVIGGIVGYVVIIPSMDDKLKDLSDLNELFLNNEVEAKFESTSVNRTINKICYVLNICFKINSLKVFL